MIGESAGWTGSQLGTQHEVTIRSKIRLMCSLVIGTSLYACERWTRTADLEEKIQALDEMYVQDLSHLLQGPHYQHRSSGQSDASNWTIQCSFIFNEEMKIEMVLSGNEISRTCQNNYARNSARRQKETKTKTKPQKTKKKKHPKKQTKQTKNRRQCQ